jgi:sarcosine oxidase subunit gamma
MIRKERFSVVDFDWQVTSPLQGEEVGGSGLVTLEEHPYVSMVQVMRRKGGDGVKLKASPAKALGLKAFPEEGRSVEGGDCVWLWSGHGQWLVLGGEKSVLDGILGGSYSVSEQTSSRVHIELRGERAKEVLMKLSSLDLDDHVFVEGHVAVTNLGHINVHMWRKGDEGGGACYGILVLSTLAKSLWHELKEAGEEYGVEVFRAYD